MAWLSTSLLAVAFPLWWVLVGYFRRLPTENISFLAADGWCKPATEGIGVHCFGDFQLPRILLDAPSVWDNGGLVVAYSPTGLVPNLGAKWLEGVGLGVRGSLIVFLVALGAAMVIPALLAAIKGAPGIRGPLPLLLFFAAAAPVLIALDRGNSVGFAVPFILLFALYAGRDPRWVAPVAIVAAAAVRPQFILLAVGLLAFRRTRDALAAVGGAIALTGLSFLIWPGSPVDNVRAWWANISGYAGTTSPGRDINNASAARGVSIFGNILEKGPSFIGSVGHAIQDFTVAHPSIPGNALLIGCIVAFVLRRGSIPRPIAIIISIALQVLVPGLSFSYYLVFAVVVAVLICGPSSPADLHPGRRAAVGLLSALNGTRIVHRCWAWLLLITTALTIAPLVIGPSEVGSTPIIGSVGLMWLAVCVAPLVWGGVRWLMQVARALRSSREAGGVGS